MCILVPVFTQPAMFELWSKYAINEHAARCPMHYVLFLPLVVTKLPESAGNTPLASFFHPQKKLSSAQTILTSANIALVRLLTNKVKLLNLDEITNPCEATDGEIITRRLVHKNHRLWQRGSWLSSSNTAFQDKLLQTQLFTVSMCKQGLGTLSLKENTALILSKRSSTRYSSLTDWTQMKFRINFIVVKLPSAFHPTFFCFECVAMGVHILCLSDSLTPSRQVFCLMNPKM